MSKSLMGLTEVVDRLTRQHRMLDERVTELDRHKYLSPAEQAEVQRLKKLRLAARDQLHRLRMGMT